MDSWKENMMLIENIIDEIIQDDKLEKYNDQIKYEIHKQEQYYKNKRFDYDSYYDLNKELLNNMNVIIENIKQDIERDNQENAIDNLHKNIINDDELYQTQTEISNKVVKYTRNDLMMERQNEFNNKLESMRREFNNHNIIKPPETVDFADNAKQPNKKIDSLMEEEILKRQYDTQQISSLNEQEKKKAEEWFSNPNANIDMMTREKQQINDKDKIKIFDNDTPIKKELHTNNEELTIKKPILKKVSFENTETNKSTTNKIDDILEKLKKERGSGYDNNDNQIETKINMNNDNDTHNMRLNKIQEIRSKIQNINHNNEDNRNNNDINRQNIIQEIENENQNEKQILNCLIINKYSTIQKMIPFLKTPINISLNEYNMIIVKIYENNIIVHETEAIINKKDGCNNYQYYWLLKPYRKYTQNNYDVKIFDNANHELNFSLNVSLQIDKIFEEDIEYTCKYQNIDELNKQNTLLISIKNIYETGLTSIMNWDMYIDNDKLIEFLPVDVTIINKDAERNDENVDKKEKEKEKNLTLIDIKSLYSRYQVKYLIIDRKYSEKIKEKKEITLRSKQDIRLAEMIKYM